MIESGESENIFQKAILEQVCLSHATMRLLDAGCHGAFSKEPVAGGTGACTPLPPTHPHQPLHLVMVFMSFACPAAAAVAVEGQQQPQQ